MGLFKVVFYTKGSFVKDEGLTYEGGNVYAVSGQDPDYWSYFEAVDLIKDMDSAFKVEDVKMWWKTEKESLGNDLKPFDNDVDASKLAVCAEENKCDVEIYAETRLPGSEKTFMERLIGKEKGHVVDEEIEEVNSESSEDSLNGIHFEDSEEERMHDFDDLIGEGPSHVEKGGRAGIDDAGNGVGAGTSNVHDPVKAMISPRKKTAVVTSPTRKSDRLNTLRTKNIMGPGRDAEEPLVIPEDDEEESVGSAIGSSKWEDIQRNMTQ
ncbi:uncharacterized protein LOC131628014 [Vicia villosa]|uniref:uncharacterized protein LOC131628014 n=1 Tax=Vicia villosa TaxID=3911 RepID=UPI00273AE8B8|nr:uncharacterized protein LOC131628014 [Vicia villosa]